MNIKHEFQIGDTVMVIDKDTCHYNLMGKIIAIKPTINSYKPWRPLLVEFKTQRPELLHGYYLIQEVKFINPLQKLQIKYRSRYTDEEIKQRLEGQHEKKI